VTLQAASLYTGKETSVCAADLLKEYKANYAATKEKYKDSELIVEGVILELEPNLWRLKLTAVDK
jgi:hypothetical protein